MSQNRASRTIYCTSTVTIGEFRCLPDDPLWRSENCSSGFLAVFPRVPVGISQARREPVVADANRVMFYNRGQRYRRTLISDCGDECEFFGVDPTVLRDLVRLHDPRTADSSENLYVFSDGPGDATAYLDQRLLYRSVRRGVPMDALEIEERVLDILRRVVATAYRTRSRSAAVREDTVRAHRDRAEAVRVLLSRHLSEPLTLDQIARSVHTSPYHLCRLFRRSTGMTIHRYRDRLRLRAALDRVADAASSLTPVALGLGYSSHSHFTQTFHREFGLTPRAVRILAAAR